MTQWSLILVILFCSSSFAARISADDIIKKSFNWTQDTAIVSDLSMNIKDGEKLSFLHFFENKREIVLIQKCKQGKPDLNFSTELSPDELLPINSDSYNFSFDDEDRKHYIVKAVAKDLSTDKNRIANKLLWIKKDNYLVQKIEAYNFQKNFLHRIIVTEAQRTDQAWRVIRARYENKLGKNIELEWSNFSKKNIPNLKDVQTSCWR